MPYRPKELKEQYLYPAIRTYYDEPLVLDHGMGTRVWDIGGRDYLDFFGGILTVSVGHSNPRVVGRMGEQLKKIIHTSTCYLNEPMLEVAEKLAKITPGRLQKSFFLNSGTEAIETAIVSAKAHTGRHEIISLRHSYHGRSAVATTLTGHAPWKTVASTTPGIVHAHNGYCYRCPFKQTYPGCDLACARDLEELIKTTTSGAVAALIAEPIQGVGGFITPPPEFFQIAVEIARKYGGVFICDEVQTGFGRTGGKLFGIEHWGVEPEIMVFAKGLANGAAIGCTIALPEIADNLKGSTISTFGGNPLSMAAASATIDVILDEEIPQHVEQVGGLLMAGLRELHAEHKFIGDVRGKGLMIGVELVGENKTPAPQVAVQFMECARELGMLIGRGGLYGNVLRLTPPMTVKDTEVAEALDKLGKVCDQLNQA
ncbi:MAG: aspartate aminotransferase family protein [Bacillota bacterium]|nr:aspartate aminotransferase family protein [Bacillota bacterium]